MNYRDILRLIAVVLCIFMFSLMTVKLAQADELSKEQKEIEATKALEFVKSQYPSLKELELEFDYLFIGAGYLSGVIYINPQSLSTHPLPVISIWTSFVMRNLNIPETEWEIIAFSVFHESGHALNDKPGLEDDFEYLRESNKAKTILDYKNTTEERKCDDFAIKTLNSYRKTKHMSAENY